MGCHGFRPRGPRAARTGPGDGTRGTPGPCRAGPVAGGTAHGPMRGSLTPFFARSIIDRVEVGLATAGPLARPPARRRRVQGKGRGRPYPAGRNTGGPRLDPVRGRSADPRREPDIHDATAL